MTLHMFRLYAEKPDDTTLSEANQYVTAWLDNNTPWEKELDQYSLSVSTGGVDGTGTEYFNGDFRFEFLDDATALQDEAEQSLQNIVPSYVVGYHPCSHDGKVNTYEVTETVTANHDTAVSLSENNFIPDTVLVHQSGWSTVYQDSVKVGYEDDSGNVIRQGDDYEVDEENGTITVLSTGDLAGGTDYDVSYTHRVAPPQCSFKSITHWPDEASVPNDIPSP